MSVHEETIRIVDNQMKQMAVQMQALDEFVTRAKEQNAMHHGQHTASLATLSQTVQASYGDIKSHFTTTHERVQKLGDEMSVTARASQTHLASMPEMLGAPLAQLRDTTGRTLLEEYQPTGETPQKTMYLYPTDLPRTSQHAELLAGLRSSARHEAVAASPSKGPMAPATLVFQDVVQATEGLETRTLRADSLRELDANVVAAAHEAAVTQAPKLTASGSVSVQGKMMPVATTSVALASTKTRRGGVIEGRENVPVGVARRRSPRSA